MNDETKALIEAAARLEACFERLEAAVTAQSGAITDVGNRLREIETSQAEYGARQEEFWTRGKGAEWDLDIKANTSALKDLTKRVNQGETDARVTKAKAAGILIGAGASGGVVMKVLGAVFGA